jgi:hypothetical protein
MAPIYVRGVGLWTPGFSSPEAWCRSVHQSEEGEGHETDCRDELAVTPPAQLLEGNLRRRAPALSRMSVEVFEQAATRAGCDTARTPSVWATAHGEHTTAHRLLKMMPRGEGKLSPTHFHNSVHNTPSGYASIATRNVCSSTTLTGGAELVMAAFLEAWCRLETCGGDVLLVLADEQLQTPFESPGMTAPLALAFCLSAQPAGATAVLSDLRRDTVPRTRAQAPFGPLYVSAALPLIERIVGQRAGTVALELDTEGEGPVWCLDLKLTKS